MKNRWLAVIAVLVVFFTTAFGIGLSKTADKTPLNALSEADLALIYSNNAEQLEKLRFAKQKMEDDLQQIKSSQQERLIVIQKQRALLAQLKKLACKDSLGGSGLVVTVSTEGRTFLGWDWAINVVNTAFSAGAKGVSINGRRLSPRWYVPYEGGFLNIEGFRVSPPFAFEFVGDGESILSAFKLPSGVFDSLRARGVKIEYKIEKNVLLKACDK